MMTIEEHNKLIEDFIELLEFGRKICGIRKLTEEEIEAKKQQKDKTK